MSSVSDSDDGGRESCIVVSYDTIWTVSLGSYESWSRCEIVVENDSVYCDDRWMIGTIGPLRIVALSKRRTPELPIELIRDAMVVAPDPVRGMMISFLHKLGSSTLSTPTTKSQTTRKEGYVVQTVFRCF